MVEPSLQQDISTQFEQQQSEKLIATLNTSPHLIFEVFEVFPEVLLSSNTRKIESTFKVLESLIKAFGISFVLQLNQFEIITLLEGLAQQGWEKQINKILELCLIEFSFDQERTYIEFLANLWIAHNMTASSYPTEKRSVTPFISLFCNLQKVLGLIPNVPTMTPDEKKELAQNIRDALKNENFENKEFNALEKDLAIYYSNELIRTLSTIQPKASIKSIAEIENEIKSLYQGGSTPGGPEEPKASSPLGKSSAPQNRKFFVLGERISEDESIRTEYKEYGLPFGETVENTLKKTIGAFLNRRGGRIYIGISDAKVVKGIYLKFKQRDVIRLQIQNMVKFFEPSIGSKERVKIVEVPIRHPKTHEVIPGLFVLKIIVKQGDTSKLYSINNFTYESYIRNEGQNSMILARDIAEYIIKRDKNPEPSVPDSEFDDPEPDEIEDVYEQKEGDDLSTSKILYDQMARRRQRERSNPRNDFNNNLNNPIVRNNKGFSQDKEKPQKEAIPNKSAPQREVIPPQNIVQNQANVDPLGRYSKPKFEKEEKKEAQPNVDKNRLQSQERQERQPHRKVYAVFVKGLPPVQQDEFNKLLSKMGYKTLFLHRMFRLKDGSCNGNAFLNFNDLQEANHLINSWNNKNVLGSVVQAELQKPGNK